MKFIKLSLENQEYINQCALLLLNNFDHSWESLESATEEVLKSIEDNKISIIVVNDDDLVLGWIGGIRKYDGNVWEIHPLVVHKEYQRRGIGKLVVSEFEKEVSLRGGITIILGTDDEDNRTTLGGIDIYPDIFNQVEGIKNLDNHPFEFYINMGFKIVGVIPDANGFGKPDILMAKRVIEDSRNG
jgi:aminoglycoside 6'-N-acetyltransferase I